MPFVGLDKPLVPFSLYVWSSLDQGLRNTKQEKGLRAAKVVAVTKLYIHIRSYRENNLHMSLNIHSWLSVHDRSGRR